MSIDANQEADILASSKERMRQKNKEAEEKRRTADAGKKDEESNFAYGEDGFASMHDEEAEFSDAESKYETKPKIESDDKAATVTVEVEDVEISDAERLQKTLTEAKENGTIEDGEFSQIKTGQEQERNENEIPTLENAVGVKEQKEYPLETALKSARELYADTDYRDRTATQRIRKYFNMRPDEKQQEGENIIGARKIYEDALRALKEDRVAKLQAKSLEGKELEKEIQNLFAFFNHKETLEFYDARTKAKMDYLAETENKSALKQTWDKVALQSNKIANWYNKKVPTAVKWGLAGAAMLPGMQTFAVGKRAWGAFMMVAAGGMQVDKLAQFKDSVVNKKESKKVAKEVMREDEGGEKRIDYEWLNSVLDDNISQLDRRLDSMVVRSQVNKFVAFSGAAFLGASTFSRVMEIMQHGGAAKEAGAGILSRIFGFKGLAAGAGVAGSVESAKGFDMSNVNPENFEGFEGDSVGQMENIGEAKSSGAFASSYEKFKAFTGLQGETSLADAMENRSGAPIDILKETGIPAGAELPVETMTVKEGSSFIGTLKHVYLENHREEFLKLHPEMAKFSNDQIAFRLAQAYGDKALNGELPDFVKAGAKMTFDPKTMEVHFLKPGDVGHFADVEVPNETVEVAKNPDSPELKAVEVSEAGDATGVEEKIEAAIDQHKEEELLAKKEVIGSVQGDFNEAKVEYAEATDSALHQPEGGDGPSVAQYEEMGKADKAMQQSAEYVRNNTDFYPETSKQTILIQKAIAGGDRGIWNEFQNLEYDRAIADDKVGPRLAAVREQFEKEYDPEGYRKGRSYNFNPKDGETIREWTKRVAVRIMEKRYKIAS